METKATTSPTVNPLGKLYGSQRKKQDLFGVCILYDRGQPGLDELEFDDLYNNLKVYEHELKGVSNSSSQNIAFLSTEVKGSTLKQSTADPANIPKGYTQAASSKVQTAPNCASHSDEIICSFFAQQASMPTTHDDEDLLQIDEDAMEEIDIRWQVAMITARIRKFMRKTGRPIDLKPKNGITFDKSKIDEDALIVHKNFHCFLYHIVKNGHHTTLESSGSIAQTEWHTTVRESSVWARKSSFLLIFRINWDLKIP
ncbi:hypothetical protein Tco_0813879 [Tanacetum coccineum]